MDKVIKQVVEYYSGRLPNVFSSSERFFTDGNNIVDRAQVRGNHILCTFDEYLKIAEDMGYGPYVQLNSAYSAALAKAVRYCALSGYDIPVICISKFIELSAKPSKQLAYWNGSKHQIKHLLDSSTMQEIEKYLKNNGE